MVALTLFFNEKFFGAVKLAVLSFNNLLLHFEDEYQDYYTEKIEHFLMPLLNQFKSDLMEVILKYEENLKADTLANFSLSKEELKTIFLPNFRKAFEEKVIAPSFESINLQNLKNQYLTFVEGMNLLSFD